MAPRQLAMVINLDKCTGCQSCTVTCRRHWLGKPGSENNYFIWAETKPGLGWPRDWMNKGKKLPDPVTDYGGTWQFNWDEVYTSKARTTHLQPKVKETGEKPTWGVCWDEDQGGGTWPNGYMFYMPRTCNHCSEAPCIEACEAYCSKQGKPVAMHKRDDGIVLIDQSKCLSCGMCLSACNYKIPMKNSASGNYEMCDMCVTRVDDNYAPVCAKSCPARAMSFGYLDDVNSFVNKLVKQYKVALPLRPDYGTQPNVYYVPPFVRPTVVGEGNKLTEQTDIPIELLREYFGPEVDQALATLKEQRQRAKDTGEVSELMKLLIVYKWADAFTPFEIVAPGEMHAKPVPVA